MEHVGSRVVTPNCLLVGVDGGATEVKAHAVACDDLRCARSFALRPESAGRVYPRVADFVPLPVAEQVAQRDAGRISRSHAEIEQGRLWVQAAAHAIAEVATACAARRVLVGLGMPGLKTPDGRGINVINNGPRIPEYVAELEAGLAAAGIELVAPIAALGSDADYCGVGEEHAADGLFRDVANAYYVGCGTGIADAMKLRGSLVPFDQAKTWIQKSWQMPSALGPTFEKLVSASALNRIWGHLQAATRGSGNGVTAEHKAAVGEKPPSVSRRQPGGEPPIATSATADPDDQRSATGAAPLADFPEQAALAGDPRATAWLDAAALLLAELIFERIWTIKNGRADTPHRGEAYARLSPAHDYRGTLLDRVIIGQRGGQIYANPACRVIFAERLEAYLAAFMDRGADAEMARAHLVHDARAGTGPMLRPGFLRSSRLRAAPALGAAIAAVRHGYTA